jgi:flavin reductase (DIM6/NTAB) family NADH-FMN oxidoreductase RutF
MNTQGTHHEDRVTDADFSTHLKAAMRRMPSAVSIITTRHPETAEPMGLVASAVIPVSMEPPSMLVSINRSSSAHPTIVMAEGFCVNLLSVEQHPLVTLFSSTALRDQRFADDIWEERCDLPSLRAATASISCRVRHRTSFGTHDLFIGEVTDIMLNEDSEPLAWVEGGLARIVAFEPGS